MNIEKNPKTFNYLFTLFIQLGEKELGRQLTNDELSKIRSSIEKKCTNISKKDIVKEIYSLELAKQEKTHGHLGIKKRLSLANHVSNKTETPISLSFSSKPLTKTVSRQFANIDLSDTYGNIKLFDYKQMAEDRDTLKNIYSKDVFNYRAPLGTKNKLKRLACLGAVGLVFLSSQLFNTQESVPTKLPSEPTTSQQILSEPEVIKLEDTINDDLLQDFKNRYAAEYNLAHGQNLVDSWDLKIREISHTYIYKVKTLDANGKETYKYMTKANPTETKAYLDSHGYEYEAISNFNNDVPVVSAVNSDKTELYEAYVYIEGKCVSIIDGSSPEKLEENDNSPNILLNMRKCFSEITRDPPRKSVYTDYLKEYYTNTPKNALDKDVTFEFNSDELTK